MKIVSYNLHDYTPDEADTAKRRRQRALIRDLAPDVLCVQEFLVRTDDPHFPALAEGFARFCEQLGMQGRLAFSRSYCHVGVLWRPEITLRGWRDYRHWPWHHNAGVAVLDVGASEPLEVVSGHFSPFWPSQREHEATLLGAVTPSEGWMLAGLDSNTSGEDPHYDPEPYRDQTPGLRHQLFQARSIDPWPPAGPVLVNRNAAALLTHHGLHDVAPALGVPFMPTTGHYPADPHGYRRVDVFRATKLLMPYITRYWLISPEEHPTVAEFDHAPIGCSLSL